MSSASNIDIMGGMKSIFGALGDDRFAPVRIRRTVGSTGTDVLRRGEDIKIITDAAQHRWSKRVG